MILLPMSEFFSVYVSVISIFFRSTFFYQQLPFNKGYSRTVLGTLKIPRGKRVRTLGPGGENSGRILPGNTPLPPWAEVGQHPVHINDALLHIGVFEVDTV